MKSYGIANTQTGQMRTRPGQPQAPLRSQWVQYEGNSL